MYRFLIVVFFCTGVAVAVLAVVNFAVAVATQQQFLINVPSTSNEWSIATPALLALTGICSIIKGSQKHFEEGAGVVAVMGIAAIIVAIALYEVPNSFLMLPAGAVLIFITALLVGCGIATTRVQPPV